ncbi:hypothetical protein M5D96_001585 [Drosophila gunungcola]|uniref:Uncharacterized protein n=1 Tax=Drosophila gunungcola TaxID=103775 RepID=A0A9P9YZ89_9MUSC|nr:hypothetical protein M5D96_001585 [Drosophila gunungcola]
MGSIAKHLHSHTHNLSMSRRRTQTLTSGVPWAGSLNLNNGLPKIKQESAALLRLQLEANLLPLCE